MVRYTDANCARNSDDRKNTFGGYFYLGSNLVACLSKKQDFISLSTTKAEYITMGSCCTQLLWVKKMLYDYSLHQKSMHVYFNNTNAINISKIPIQHSRTKRIDIRHHFIRDLVESQIIQIEYVSTEN